MFIMRHLHPSEPLSLDNGWRSGFHLAVLRNNWASEL
jgi:hypothetical protein